MTVVSSKEFATNQDMYFNLAAKEDICIDNGKKMFQLRYSPVEEDRKRVYYEPDEDFYRSISMDKLLEGVLEDVHQFYASKGK